MKVLEIQIPDDIASRVEAAAHDRGVSVDELICTSLEEKLTRDEAFQASSKYVLSKNAELYNRLS